MPGGPASSAMARYTITSGGERKKMRWNSGTAFLSVGNDALPDPPSCNTPQAFNVDRYADLCTRGLALSLLEAQPLGRGAEGSQELFIVLARRLDVPLLTQ